MNSTWGTVTVGLGAIIWLWLPWTLMRGAVERGDQGGIANDVRNGNEAAILVLVFIGIGLVVGGAFNFLTGAKLGASRGWARWCWGLATLSSLVGLPIVGTLWLLSQRP